MRASTAATNVPTAKLPAKNSWLRVSVPSASCVQRRASNTRVMAPATALAIWSSCQSTAQGVGGGALRLRDAIGAPGGAAHGDVDAYGRHEDGHVTSCAVTGTDGAGVTGADSERVSTTYTPHPTAAASRVARSFGRIVTSNSQNNMETSFMRVRPASRNRSRRPVRENYTATSGLRVAAR